MNAVIRRLPLLVAFALHPLAYADEDHAHIHAEHLGKVSFPTSCDPKV
ncbi:MAG: hypothetical protein JF605_23465, partial [Burkholderia sp.]|nr:hypothetical protein [Burkholderia sp.]